MNPPRADFFVFCCDILTFLDNWQYFCRFRKGNKIKEI